MCGRQSTELLFNPTVSKSGNFGKQAPPITWPLAADFNILYNVSSSVVKQGVFIVGLVIVRTKSLSNFGLVRTLSIELEKDHDQVSMFLY